MRGSLAIRGSKTPQSSANNAAQALAQAPLVSITIDYLIRYIDPEQHHECGEL